MTHPLMAAAAGALVCLCVVVLITRRTQIVSAARRSPLVAGALVTLAAAGLWLAHLAGRRRLPLTPSPDRDLTPTPRVPPVLPAPRPAEVDHAAHLPPDVQPDPAAPLAVEPANDLGDLILRLDERAGRRGSNPAE
jgi:hypothetical protein